MKRLLTLLSGLLLILSFGSRTASARITEPTDIRVMAPAKPVDLPSPIALPESGTDLGSVSSDWAQREVHLVTGGADERFLNSANQKLDRFFLNKESGAPETDSSNLRTPASDDDGDSWIKPRSVHMSHLGEFELGFGQATGRTKLSCDLTGGNGAEWNLSKPVSTDLDLRLHHETNVNSLQLRLNW